jgi:hypothetical protein
MSNDEKDIWKLDEIKLELETYGKDKGKYTGKVRFTNGHFEAFQFRIRHEMAERYIELIAEDLVKSADQLSSDLVNSLGLRETKQELT